MAREPDDLDQPDDHSESWSAADIKAAFTATSPGWVYLESLAADERRWLSRMVNGVAHRYNVDHDDLLQELQLRLRRCTILDHGRSAVRSWLTQRATWLALTMLRSGRRRPETTPLDAKAPDPPAPPEIGLDHDWSVERLQGLGLSRDQAQNILLLAWDIDIAMQDYAAFIEKTYAKVRQDRSRGLGKIKNLFELTADEEAVLVAYRRYGSIAAAATRLNLDDETVRRHVAAAEKKIDRALGRPPAADPSTGDPAGDKDESDVQ